MPLYPQSFDVEAIWDPKFNTELVFMSKIVETSGTGFQFLVVYWSLKFIMLSAKWCEWSPMQEFLERVST
jgi:hypothetical protein